MRDDFHLFVYGTLLTGGSAAERLSGCARISAAQTEGTLYDIGGRFPALLLGGGGTVHGELWRCPIDRLAQLDDYEGVRDGLFTRVGVRVDGVGCWTYVAGPRLAPRLTPDARIAGGRWRAGSA